MVTINQWEDTAL